MAQVKVVALERGHDGRVLREPGEEFHVDESRLTDGSTWFAAVDKAPPPKKADPRARPPGAGPAKGSKVESAEPGQPASAGDIA